MFGGSLHGHWQAIVTFQQMIILADKDGTIEMTPSAISATTSIPLDIIEAGIAVLEAPDRFSRTPDEDGRRIIRINPDRPWGWHITNYAHYRAIRTSEERREYHKTYWQKKRKKLVNQPDSTGTQQNQPIAVSSKQEAKAVNQTAPVAGLNPTAWDTWVSYRTEIKKPLRPVSILAAKKALAAYGDDQEAVVQQSIANGYQGLVPLKSGGNNGTRQQVDNSAIGQVRAANKRARDAQRRTDAAGVGENDHDVRAPLEVKLRG